MFLTSTAHAREVFLVEEVEIKLSGFSKSGCPTEQIRNSAINEGLFLIGMVRE